MVARFRDLFGPSKIDFQTHIPYAVCVERSLSQFLVPVLDLENNSMEENDRRCLIVTQKEEEENGNTSIVECSKFLVNHVTNKMWHCAHQKYWRDEDHYEKSKQCTTSYDVFDVTMVVNSTSIIPHLDDTKDLLHFST
jgi:hypothetical protein